MPQVCLYFHLHQPWRLQDMTVFDVGVMDSYFKTSTEDENKIIFQKVTQKSYLPMLSLLLELCVQNPQFRCAFSITGVFIEQARAYAPEVLQLLKKLMATGSVEILAETYYHSLAALYSPEECAVQVGRHVQLLQQEFQYTPTVFRNTELIYSNAIAQQIKKLGFVGMLTEAVPRYLHGRPKTKVYYSTAPAYLPLLLKHAELSDDIAFRFGEKSWNHYPLTVEKYMDWVEVYSEQECVNLFMDFETFGEHQWKETGIFEFFARFVDEFLKKKWNTFVTPAEVFGKEQQMVHYSMRQKKKRTFIPPPERIYDVPEPISWADVDRDLTAWLGNDFQVDTLQKMYELVPLMHASTDTQLVINWRKLQSSDHYYYMCTKWAADGDVHAYFSPYQSPHEAYRRFCIALSDLKGRLTTS